MDIFNLLESLGGELPKTKKEKVQENTAKSAKTPDSSSKAKAADHAKDNVEKVPQQKTEIKLSPQVICIGNNFRLTISGVKTLDDCIKQLFDLGYKEILLSGKCILIDQGTLLFQTYDSAVQDSILVNMPMNVCFGEKRMELDADDFPGLDKDEISISDVHERWSTIHPECEGNGLSYDPRLGVATPCFSEVIKNKQKNINLPVTVSIWGETITVTQQDIGVIGVITCEQLCEYLSTAYSMQYNETELSLYECGEAFYAKLNAKKKAQPFNCDDYFVDKKAKVVNVKEKYRLPFTLHMANFNISASLNAEDFGGKEKVDQEEIMDYVKNRYPMFRSSDRKADILYLKDKNIVSVAAMSGKKGNIKDANYSKDAEK